ncbi:hypothetical protein OG389_13630 [Streptomyces sp. NBC_00435]|uniref:hypothetical protein n=1 Tax=Streptomyces sp. NBC_00435 TaxID=2903649 RepID=UPI002E1CE643
MTTKRKAPAQRIEAELLEKFTRDGIRLSGFEKRYVESAAQHIARAEKMDRLVKDQGSMVPGGNRSGVFVLHPGIAEARQSRALADKMLALIQKPTTAAPSRRAAKRGEHH